MAEIISKRTRCMKIFPVPEQARTYRAEVHSKSLHYEETPGDGDWKEIDTTLESSDTEWTCIKNAWKLTLAKNYSAEWPVTIERRGGFTLQYKVAAVGHVATDRTLTLLQTAQSSAGSLSDGAVTFEDVFNGVDITYQNGHDCLKQTITISESAKNALKTAIQNQELDPDGWLAIGTKIDWIGDWTFDLNENDETEDRVTITAPPGFLAHARDRLTRVQVWDENEDTPSTKPRYRRINHPTYGTVLLMMIPLSWLATSVGAVTIDPTYYSSTSDGWMYYWNSNWTTCRNGTTAQTVDDNDGRYESSAAANYDGSNYYIVRSFFYFDTSGIPDDATVTDAALNLYGYLNTESGVSAQKGTQGDPLTDADFDSFSGDEYGHDDSWGAGYQTITFDAIGRSEIVLDGMTLICAREYQHDYSNSAPGSGTTYRNGCYFADWTGTSYDPYLEITYTVPAGQAFGAIM